MRDVVHVSPADAPAVIQQRINDLGPMGILVFDPGTYDFGGQTLIGKSCMIVQSTGPVKITNTAVAFDFTSDHHWGVRGITFEGSRINADNAWRFHVVNNVFNDQPSNGYNGSAVAMNGASFGVIKNNDFNRVEGNNLGMFGMDEMTFDGNHFVDCQQPFSVQEPVGRDDLGDNLVWERNVFVGTKRAAIEVGPSSNGAEDFDGLRVVNNYFDDFADHADPGTMLPISLVGQASSDTLVAGNFIRRGNAAAGDVGVAIEMTGTGEVRNNIIENFSFAALTYQSGWDVHDNVVYNDGSSPYFGFVNNGSGSGTFGPETVVTAEPADPGWPDRA